MAGAALIGQIVSFGDLDGVMSKHSVPFAEKRLTIGELQVTRLQVTELEVARRAAPSRRSSR